MKKIKNELGEEVIAIGNLTSPVRMLQKYPKTINSILSTDKSSRKRAKSYTNAHSRL